MGHPVTLSAVILIYRDSPFICDSVCVCVRTLNRHLADVSTHLYIYIRINPHPTPSL